MAKFVGCVYADERMMEKQFQVEENKGEETMGNLRISYHADERIKERLPGMKSAKRRKEFAEEVIRCGVRLGDSRGVERAYLLSCKKEAPEFAGRDLILYADRVFVLEGNCLVTALPCNPLYRRRLEQNRRKKNRRVRSIGYNDGNTAA